jgi:D-tyrosyl-tRNA(Tyr) deacylase
MVAVLQRVLQASVTIDSRPFSEIGKGLLILLGVSRGDEEKTADELAEKVARLRIFEDDQNKMNRSLLDTRGSALVVSQFTLLADTTRGRRPGFEEAAPPDRAEELYQRFVKTLHTLGVPAETGLFGSAMEVHLVNDGPVTLILDSKGKRR